MEGKEKEYIKLKVALVFKKVIEENKRLAEKNKGQGKFDSNLITSYRKWETASGVPIASISEIMVGERNAAITTLVTLIHALGQDLETFGSSFDSITDAELREFMKESMKMKKKKDV